MSSDGYKLLASIVDSTQGIKTLIKMDLDVDLFKVGEGEVFTFINDHANSYGVLPNRKTILDETETTLPKVSEPTEFYLKAVEDRYVHTKVKEAVLKAKQELNNLNEHKALSIISKVVLKLMTKIKRHQIINYTQDAHGLLTNDYKKHLSMGDKYGLSVGWPFFDNMINGLQGGDILTLVGRPATGKSYLILWMALFMWRFFNVVPLLVTMEMNPLILSQRIAAMYSKLPITSLKKAMLSTKQWKKMSHDLSSLHKNHVPFWIVDGNLATSIDEIVLLSHQLNPGVILIDGAYLVRAKNSKQPKWEKVSETMEGMKRLAEDQSIPVIGTYQFNKDATKATTLGLEHIGGGEVIGQMSSIILGLLQKHTIETIIDREVTIMKGRSGESGTFKIHWIFDQYPFMDFSQKSTVDDEMGNL